MSHQQLAVVGESPVIGRRTAWFLVFGFVATLLTPAVHQACASRGANFGAIVRLVGRQPTAEQLHTFETNLAKESLLAKQMRRWYHAATLTTLRQGSDQVVVGRDDFLFYRVDVDYCAAQQRHEDSKPRAAATRDTYTIAAEHLVKVNKLFQNRGIHLVVAPIPVSPAIYPEKVWPGYRVEQGPASNIHLSSWQDDLRRRGVDVVDITDALWKAKLEGAPQLFISHNTHWSPHGTRVAGRALADHLQPLLANSPSCHYGDSTERKPLPSDLLPMLDLPTTWKYFRHREYEVCGIAADDQPPGSDSYSPVLLLGDSFSTVHRAENFGGRIAAGLPAQIMKHLGVGVKTLAIDAAGPGDVRAQLKNRPELLTDTKVVVWAFVTRHLCREAAGNWAWCDLPPVADHGQAVAGVRDE